MIPERERGYSIEPDTLIVHERYQDHAPRAMRTSAFGVSEYAKGREPIPCERCFPQPKAAKVQQPKARRADPPSDFGEQLLTRGGLPREVEDRLREIDADAEARRTPKPDTEEPA